MLSNSFKFGKYAFGARPALTALPARFFDLHEYHSKKLMGQYGINV